MSNKITLVKASAGSGKTYDLMRRLSDCIKDGIEPEHLFATTFTVKAAAELQSRIRKKLIEDGEAELASRVFDGLIGTVDGICGRLLSEYAIEAGLSPSLTVIDENDSDDIFKSSLSSAFQQNAERVREIDDAAERLGLIGKSRYESADWKKDVKTITETARNNRLGKEELEACASKSIDALKAIFHDDTNFSLEYLVKSLSPTAGFVSTFNNTNKTIKRIKEFIKTPTWITAAGLGKAEVAKKDIKAGFDTETLDEINEKLLDSRELFKDISTVIKGVFHFASLALESYQEYKEKLGLVDFVDQECRTLELFENNSRFRELIRERLSIAMVDEFQDTSPVQLALFLKINECAENGSVWVGDPKQAIYGFRGTDTEIMNAVVESIPEENVSSLKYSWRSKENLVNLSNAIFSRTFSRMRREDVVLSVPPERKEKAEGGEIEAWHLGGGSKEERFNMLARGINNLIKCEGVKAEDIGVLMRTNSDCTMLSSALSEWGIPSSASSGPLMDTPEARLVMAAFRFTLDSNDTAALALLCAYYGESNNLLDTIIKEKDVDFKTLRELPLLKNLSQMKDSTPLEILDCVITSLSLDRKVMSMEYPTKRIQNVEKLRACCIEYMNHAGVTMTAATPSGFIAYMASSESQEAEGFGEGTVNVLTYHKAKGLQWPVVILSSLNSYVKEEPFGVHVIPSSNFDVDNPLSGRSINYWPKPFGSKLKVAELNERLSENELSNSVYWKELDESRRLMYVGLTRAKDKVIFALDEKKEGEFLTVWLDSLSDEPFISFPKETGRGRLVVGNNSFDIVSKDFELFETTGGRTSSFDDVDRTPDVEYYPAFTSPSSIECSDGKAELLTDFFSVMKIKGIDGNYDALGNAVHSYISLNPESNKKETAERILKQWQVDGAVSAEDVVSSTERLYDWINENYPGSVIKTEVPMTYTDEHGTIYQGYIDMLLETPSDYVIIDHKTHNNPVDAESYASLCVGQLRLYKKAVEEATGKTVKELIINLSTLGRLYRIS